MSGYPPDGRTAEPGVQRGQQIQREQSGSGQAAMTTVARGLWISAPVSVDNAMAESDESGNQNGPQSISRALPDCGTHIR